MADDADRAQQRIENVIEGGIAIAKERARVRSLVPCNACYYCEAYVNDGAVFCDSDCQADFHYEERRKRDLGL